MFLISGAERKNSNGSFLLWCQPYEDGSFSLHRYNHNIPTFISGIRPIVLNPQGDPYLARIQVETLEVYESCGGFCTDKHLGVLCTGMLPIQDAPADSEKQAAYREKILLESVKKGEGGSSFR